MIVKDEEAVLARCLDSVKEAVDEIIIVDTGSTDNTKEIAKKYTSKVYDFKWIDDFSAARNEAYSKASMDYQMWLDADDVIPPEELTKLIALKNELDPGVNMVSMKYHTAFDDQGHPLLTSTRGRLTRRKLGIKWEDPIHEYMPIPPGNIYADIYIHHKKNPKEGDGNRNLNIYTNLEASLKPMNARQTYYFARELKDHGMWAKSAWYFEKFLDSGQGWLEDNIASCLALSIAYNTLGAEEKIVPVLIRSFNYDAPRAEICCELGYYYKRKEDYRTAFHWFHTALNLERPDSKGFVLPDYLDYIPNIECCVCRYKLGDIEGAKMYNERAALARPNSPGVEHNRKFFAEL
jgi:glycosyltransferase involved in cell wall biosynthesis